MPKKANKAQNSGPATQLDLSRCMENPDKFVKPYLQKGGDPSASFSVMGPVNRMIDKPLLHAGVVNSRAGPGALRLLIAAGANLEAECIMDGDTRTALMWASVNARYIEHLCVLLDAGASTTSSSADSFTAFGIASEKGNMEAVKEFIKRGVDPNLRAVPSMHTPLLKAVEAGHLPIVMLLQRAGADVNARGAGRFTSSALHLAAEHSNVLIVSFLLRCEGIDVDAVNVSGQTALSIAARTGSAAIAQLLLKSGADVYIASDQGHTPFFAAALEGHIPVLELLLAADSDINSTRHDSKTPLIAAANRDQLDVVRWLISKGAALERIDCDGRTAACQAASAGLHPEHRAETLRVLLEAGANPNKEDSLGRTMLCEAAVDGSLEKVKMLLAHGADGTQGPKGQTPLHLASQFGHTAVLQALLDSGLHPDTCSPSAAGANSTALFYARTPAVAQLLLDRGANVLHMSAGGTTCLHTCVARGDCVPVLQVLLAAGADPTAQQLTLDKDIAEQVAELGVQLTPAAVAGFKGDHVARAVLLEAEQRWAAA